MPQKAPPAHCQLQLYQIQILAFKKVFCKRPAKLVFLSCNGMKSLTIPANVKEDNRGGLGKTVQEQPRFQEFQLRVPHFLHIIHYLT